MKKLLLNSLLVLLCLSGCSDNVLETTKDTVPETGQYLYMDGTITASVHIGKDSAVSITVFENGKYVYQDVRNGRMSGRWPTYEYIFTSYGFTNNRNLVLLARFSDSRTFTAQVEANDNKLNLPYPMQFRRDDTILDINGDGILDSTQQLSKFSAKDFYNDLNN